MYFAADMDDNPNAEDIQSFERTGRVMFPDPAIYAAFKVTKEARIMKGFMQLRYEERLKYKNHQLPG
jgi:hypothetical protein